LSDRATKSRATAAGPGWPSRRILNVATCPYKCNNCKRRRQLRLQPQWQGSSWPPARPTEDVNVGGNNQKDDYQDEDEDGDVYTHHADDRRGQTRRWTPVACSRLTDCVAVPGCQDACCQDAGLPGCLSAIW